MSLSQFIISNNNSLIVNLFRYELFSIGNNCVIGGQVGISGHLIIGNDVIIAAKSGVTKNIASNSIIAGFPAIDIKKWKKNIIKFNKGN